MSSTYLILSDRLQRIIPKSCRRRRRLPPELTDRIIDFCHNDKATLSNCALTHSSWLATSRLHLFHTITTTGVHEKRNRANQLAHIIRDMRSTRPHMQSSVIRYIKEVKIDSFVDPHNMAELVDATLLICAIRLHCDHERLPSPPVHAILRHSPNQRYPPPLRTLSWVGDIVTHIKFSNVSFNHSNDIWPFLSSFPRLQHLELERVGFLKPGGSGPPAESTFYGIPLSTIRMTTASMGFIIDSLIKVAGSLLHLEDFGIVYQDTRQEAALLQLADAIQMRVKCLRFNSDSYTGYGWHGGWRPSAFDMGVPEFVGRFLSLTTLVLDNLRLDHGRSNVSFDWIEDVLRQLSSPIRELVLEMTVSEYLQLDAIPWAFINRIVHPDDPQFKELACVRVLVKRGSSLKDLPPIYGDVVRSKVARRLPALDLLGLLRCDTVDS